MLTLANTGEVPQLINRSGNRPSHEGAPPLFDESIALCRAAGFKKILLCGDTDFSQTHYLHGWHAAGDVRFVFQAYELLQNSLSDAVFWMKAQWIVALLERSLSMTRTMTDAVQATRASRTSALTARPAHQAYLVLQVGFAALPIIAGLDKFFHWLVNWDMYLAPMVTQVLPVEAHSFMLVVGVVEIAAGILVAIWPRVGGYVVTLWLWGIIANLLMIPGFYDIALRDFGLSLGALALARLSSEYGYPVR